jgi:hypothetical protein
MILTVKPIEKSELRILYICSTKEIEQVMDEAEGFDMQYISSDDGVHAEDDDPFLLSFIYTN